MNAATKLVETLLEQQEQPKSTDQVKTPMSTNFYLLSGDGEQRTNSVLDLIRFAGDQADGAAIYIKGKNGHTRMERIGGAWEVIERHL